MILMSVLCDIIKAADGFSRIDADWLCSELM